jgi:hypothetical protein
MRGLLDRIMVSSISLLLLLSFIMLLTPFGYIDRLNMEIKDASSTAVLQVLGKDNYVAWSVRVKTYLMAQDLWETVEATTEPPKQEDDKGVFKAWSNKNSMALDVIKNSCGPETLPVIKEIPLAKIAWNTLAQKYMVSKNTNLGLSQNTSSGPLLTLSLSHSLSLSTKCTLMLKHSNKDCF